MPSRNTLNGKAFEYACLCAFEQKIRETTGNSVGVQVNDAVNTAKAKYDALTDAERAKYDVAADTAVDIIVPLEPQLEYGEGCLVFTINADAAAIGPEGDVRDVVCIKTINDGESWEIGFSCKHNHEGLKHPRITEAKDFGRAWLGYPCSQGFIDEMDGIMSSLEGLEARHSLWRDIPDKAERYYEPILNAFIGEIRRLCDEHADAPAKFLEYFFGSKDFYKIIAKESKKQTTIEGFNIYGTLNKSVYGHRPASTVTRLHLPTRLFDVSFKTNRNGSRSKTTIILTFDEGWAVSMRLHNKDEVVKLTGLSFEVELVGLANGMYTNTQNWI